MLFPRKYASCPWPDSRYREYMNGRLKKIDMRYCLNKIKSGILSVADAVEKCKNADIAFDLIGFNDIDEVEYYLNDVANEGK